MVDVRTEVSESQFEGYNDEINHFYLEDRLRKYKVDLNAECPEVGYFNELCANCNINAINLIEYLKKYNILEQFFKCMRAVDISNNDLTKEFFEKLITICKTSKSIEQPIYNLFIKYYAKNMETDELFLLFQKSVFFEKIGEICDKLPEIPFFLAFNQDQSSEILGYRYTILQEVFGFNELTDAGLERLKNYFHLFITPERNVRNHRIFNNTLNQNDPIIFAELLQKHNINIDYFLGICAILSENEDTAKAKEYFKHIICLCQNLPPHENAEKITDAINQVLNAYQKNENPKLIYNANQFAPDIMKECNDFITRRHSRQQPRRSDRTEQTYLAFQEQVYDAILCINRYVAQDDRLHDAVIRDLLYKVKAKKSDTLKVTESCLHPVSSDEESPDSQFRVMDEEVIVVRNCFAIKDFIASPLRGKIDTSYENKYKLYANNLADLLTIINSLETTNPNKLEAQEKAGKIFNIMKFINFPTDDVALLSNIDIYIKDVASVIGMENTKPLQAFKILLLGQQSFLNSTMINEYQALLENVKSQCHEMLFDVLDNIDSKSNFYTQLAQHNCKKIKQLLAENRNESLLLNNITFSHDLFAGLLFATGAALIIAVVVFNPVNLILAAIAIIGLAIAYIIPKIKFSIESLKLESEIADEILTNEIYDELLITLSTETVEKDILTVSESPTTAFTENIEKTRFVVSDHKIPTTPCVNGEDEGLFEENDLVDDNGRTSQSNDLPIQTSKIF